MQKISSLLFVLIACAGTMLADGTKIGDLYYNLNADNKTASVTYQELWSSTNYSYLTAVNIPESVEYNSVTYSVTSIGWLAFKNCSGLTSVTIPNSVTSIGESAFCYCTALTSVTIPNSVTSIGEAAFYGCSGLTSITIPTSVTSIENSAFNGCSGLTSIEIPNSVTSIGWGAFYECSGLTSVTIGNSVASIGDEAFWYCSSLTSIVVASGNTNYDSRENCNAIIETSTNTLIVGCKSTIIPNSVISIGNQAFAWCTGLTSITIPTSVTSIGDQAFYECSGLTSIEIPNSVTSIGDWAFYGCTGLTSITIPNSVTSIGDYAFLLVNNIVYSGSATGSPWGAKSVNGYVEGWLVYSDNTKTTLLGCSSVATGEITIPNSVTSIGDAAFANCTGLTSITIPTSVTSIGDWAFGSCTGLTSVTNYATTPQTIESNVFGYVNKSSCTLYVPEESIGLYQAAEVWKDFSNIQAIDTEDIDQIQLNSTVKNHKILYNGKVYILTGDKTYTVTGQQLK